VAGCDTLAAIYESMYGKAVLGLSGDVSAGGEDGGGRVAL